jgi:DegV family protein with EDD domain
MIKIVTDSTCDLPPAWFEQDNITVVPVNIQFGLDSFQEGVTITPDSFYRRIEQAGQLPTTSQPAVGHFGAVYEALAADGSEILSIHLTSKLSGTWQAASLAAQQLQERINIRVIDSLTGSVGLGWLVREAAELAADGQPLDQITAHIESRRTQIQVFIMLDDLRYARMSGRVGRVRETLVALLNVKPIISTDEGALIAVGRVRGRNKGIERMVSLAEEAVGQQPIRLAVAHAIEPSRGEQLLEQAQSRLNCQESFMTDLALSLAVHFGPGTLGLATYPA